MTDHYLKTVEWGVVPIAMYRGCLVEKIIGGFFVLGKNVKTAEGVDAVIDSSISSLKNSIK